MTLIVTWLTYLYFPASQRLGNGLQDSTAVILRLSQNLTEETHKIIIINDYFFVTVFRSSILVATPMAISRLSAGESGHGYRVARYLK